MSKCILLVSTFSSLQKYLPVIDAALDQCWKGHPTSRFLTDTPTAHPNTIVFEDSCWTELFLNGLLHVKSLDPKPTHVFHMLEDHCPLRACDDAGVAEYMQTAMNRDFVSVTFPTYGWPWTRTENRDYGDGLVRTWRKIDIEEIQGRKFAVVPRDFFRYFQVQPALWNLDYLIDACRFALKTGANDAWSFEALRWENAAQHYVADYNWPTVHHGFFTAGKVNPEAISYADPEVAGQLRGQLIRDLIGLHSPTLFRLWWTSKRASRRVARLKNRLVREMNA